MRNKDIRKAIEDSGLKYWQVADEYGLNDGNFSRLLRRELPQKQKKRIFLAIDAVKKELEVRQ